MNPLYNFLKDLKTGTLTLNYGRPIIVNWARQYAHGKDARGEDAVTVLDLGLGEGADLDNIRRALSCPVRLIGFESYPPNAELGRSKGIEVEDLNIEQAIFPLDDESVDIVVANQVLEHTKEVFWIFSEIHRVLKPGGLCIVGVPNLASLHNRIALCFGAQPPAIYTLGPHVRGFTRGSFTRFVEYGGLFKVTAYAGSNFYPFPATPGTRLARAFPSLAVSNFYRVRKMRAGNFLQVLDDVFLETPYYRGP